MNLQAQLTGLQERTRNLPAAERVRHYCSEARRLEKAGEYDAACAAISEFWPDRALPPNLEGLDEFAQADILLRAGVLAGWLGSARQAEGSQEFAKNLITRGLEIFEALQKSDQVAEAHGELALCYWREGAYDESRVHLGNALARLGSKEAGIKPILMIRLGMVEIAAGRFTEALRIFGESESLLHQSVDHAVKGTYHNQLAVLFKKLSIAERDDYVDRALIEYAAASFHFEQAGNIRYQASVENNLGFLFLTLGKFEQAHEHLRRSARLFRDLNDSVHLAQVDDTQARTLLAEGRVVEAERVIRSAVRTLEKGDEKALLAEALTTYGIVMARLGTHARARVLLDDAIKTAEIVGDLEGAARARLSIIEELSVQTPPANLATVYEAAAEVLRDSQDPSAGKRLIACACTVIDSFVTAERSRGAVTEADDWEDFSFKEEILKIEKSLIERALRDSGGSVTTAARLLGFRHHQSLIALINSRHKDLLKTRSAIRKRRHHLFSKPRKIKRKRIKTGADRSTSHISILQVEDDAQVVELVKGMFSADTFRIELCDDGDSALRKLTGSDHYDVMVVNNNISGLSGLELTKRSCNITHRRRMPIIMISTTDIEKEAWSAGVDAFLKKPQQLGELQQTIIRVLEDKLELA
jgi:CheY-like chemotaxis protein/tetratricopeptide (TPR) repeat protein